jgi:hypothetical protein
MQIDPRFAWSCYIVFSIVIVVGGYAIESKPLRFRSVENHGVNFSGPSHRVNLERIRGPGLKGYTVAPTPTARPTVDSSQ